MYDLAKVRHLDYGYVKAVTGARGCDQNGVIGASTHTAESDLDVGDQNVGVAITAGPAPTLGVVWQP